MLKRWLTVPGVLALLVVLAGCASGGSRGNRPVLHKDTYGFSIPVPKTESTHWEAVAGRPAEDIRVQMAWPNQRQATAFAMVRYFRFQDAISPENCVNLWKDGMVGERLGTKIVDEGLIDRPGKANGYWIRMEIPAPGAPHVRVPYEAVLFLAPADYHMAFAVVYSTVGGKDFDVFRTEWETLVQGFNYD